MTLVERIAEESRHLPVQAQTEALDFIVFLRGRYSGSTAPEHEEEDEISRLLKHPLQSTDGQRLSEALEQAAALNPFREIDDPVAWQREQRQDRPLPGREHAD